MNRDQYKNRIEDAEGFYISAEQLCIGLYVHLDLGWMQHSFAFSNFKIKDDEQVRKIRALNLKKIRYDPRRSDVVPYFPKTTPFVAAQPAPKLESATPPDPLQRAKRLRQLNEAILESEQAFDRNAIKVREAARNLADHPEQARETAENLVKNMVNSVITESDVVLHSISSKCHARENFVHPLNVTVLALMLAKSLDMKEEEAVMLGMAAMFHDAGKEELPRNKSFMDMHCEIGARIVQRSGLPERVSSIVLQHHEHVDGSGIPRHLKGDSIDPLARLLALVNHYDNLCNPFNPADAMTPYEALSTMYATQQQKFDSTMLKVMVRSLGVYPPGSIVQLSSGVYGIALTANPDKPMQPLVMLYVPEVARETPVVVDLAEEKDLTIRKCLRPDHLPREVFDYLGPRKRISYYFLRKDNKNGPQTDTKSATMAEEVLRDTTSATNSRRA